MRQMSVFGHNKHIKKKKERLHTTAKRVDKRNKLVIEVREISCK